MIHDLDNAIALVDVPDRDLGHSAFLVLEPKVLAFHPTVPSGSILNASSVGAKTVKGPALSSVSTSPAAFTAATRVV